MDAPIIEVGLSETITPTPTKEQNIDAAGRAGFANLVAGVQRDLRTGLDNSEDINNLFDETDKSKTSDVPDNAQLMQKLFDETDKSKTSDVPDNAQLMQNQQVSRVNEQNQLQAGSNESQVERLNKLAEDLGLSKILKDNNIDPVNMDFSNLNKVIRGYHPDKHIDATPLELERFNNITVALNQLKAGMQNEINNQQLGLNGSIPQSAITGVENTLAIEPAPQDQENAIENPLYDEPSLKTEDELLRDRLSALGSERLSLEERAELLRSQPKDEENIQFPEVPKDEPSLKTEDELLRDRLSALGSERLSLEERAELLRSQPKDEENIQFPEIPTHDPNETNKSKTSDVPDNAQSMQKLSDETKNKDLNETKDKVGEPIVDLKPQEKQQPQANSVDPNNPSISNQKQSQSNKEEIDWASHKGTMGDDIQKTLIKGGALAVNRADKGNEIDLDNPKWHKAHYGERPIGHGQISTSPLTKKPNDREDFHATQDGNKVDIIVGPNTDMAVKFHKVHDVAKDKSGISVTKVEFDRDGLKGQYVEQTTKGKNVDVQIKGEDMKFNLDAAGRTFTRPGGFKEKPYISLEDGKPVIHCKDQHDLDTIVKVYKDFKINGESIKDIASRGVDMKDPNVKSMKIPTSAGMLTDAQKAARDAKVTAAQIQQDTGVGPPGNKIVATATLDVSRTIDPKVAATAQDVGQSASVGQGTAPPSPRIDINKSQGNGRVVGG